MATENRPPGVHLRLEKGDAELSAAEWTQLRSFVEQGTERVLDAIPTGPHSGRHTVSPDEEALLRVGLLVGARSYPLEGALAALRDLLRS